MEKVWSEKVREMEYAAYYLKLHNERRAGERAGELRERKKKSKDSWTRGNRSMKLQLFITHVGEKTHGFNREDDSRLFSFL